MHFTAHLCVASCLLLVAGSVSVIPPDDVTTTNCMTFRDVLTRTIVGFSVGYLVDNPRTGEAPITPADLPELTPGEIFKAYYGVEASSRDFEHVLLQLLYSDPGPRGPSGGDQDRIMLRNNIYKAASLGTHTGLQLAREKFGLLLYLDTGDQVGDSVTWERKRCVLFKHVPLVEVAIGMELERLRNQLGEELFGRFMDFGTGSTLAIVIDDTASMGPEIESIQERVEALIEERKDTLDAPHDFVLSPFNDPTIGPRTVTSESVTYIQAVNNLTPNGGGDEAELTLSGILAAIESSKLGSTIFVFTDSDAKDVELQSAVISRAQQKDITITFLVTGRIEQTICLGSKPPTALNSLDLQRCESPSFLYGAELFRHIATNTNGQFVTFPKRDADKAAMLIEPRRHGSVLIATKSATSEDRTLIANIDRSVSEVFIKFTGSCDSAAASLNGEVLGRWNINEDGFEASVEVNDRIGSWRIVTNVEQNAGNRKCNVRVVGRSSMGFIPALAQQKTINGKLVLERFHSMQPKFGDVITILIDAYGKLSEEQITHVDIMNPFTGEILQTHNMADMTSNNLRLLIPSPPRQPFIAVVNGRGSDGTLFTRILPCIIQFVDVAISCDNFENVILRPDNQRVIVSSTITNNGPFDRDFDISVTEFQNQFLVPGSLASPSISIRGLGGSETIQFQVQVAPSVTVGTSVILSIIATSPFETPITQTCRLVVGQRASPDITNFHVETRIAGRFAQTNILSTVFNNAAIERRTEFNVLIPIVAFISDFSLEIDGVFFPGRIEEESRALELDLVGLVQARTDRVFRTTISLDPFQTVVIRLTYQQVMIRVDEGFPYEVAIVLDQPVLDFRLDIRICETNDITALNILGFRTDQTSVSEPLPVDAIERAEGNIASVLYTPDVREQTEFSPFGLNGKFSMEYRVRGRDNSGVGVRIGGMFVHYYTPNFESIPKRIVFVLDKSGSMRGNRIEQLKQAMSTILDGIGLEDQFSIVLFDSRITVWRPELRLGTVENRRLANDFVQSIIAGGGTNILAGLDTGVQLLEDSTNEEIERLGELVNGGSISNFIVFLTDGQPTSGETNWNTIIDRVTERNNNRFAVHSIALGGRVSFFELQRLSALNGGISLQILSDLSASLQISDFFQRVAVPEVPEFVLNYRNNRVQNVVQERYSGFGRGEVVFFGEVDPRVQVEEIDPFDSIGFEIVGAGDGITIEGNTPVIDLENLCPPSQFSVRNFFVRLRDFLQLDAYIQRSRVATDIERPAAELAVLNAALSFGLVVPRFTALIVERPDTDQQNNVRKTINKHIIREYASSTQIRVIEMLTEMSQEKHLNPHITVNILPQLTVCFNWEGQANKIYNLANDSISGVSVNVKLQRGPYMEGSNLYLGEIGFNFARNGVKLIIDATSLVVKIGKSASSKYSTSEPLKLLKRGISIEIKHCSVHSSKITVQLYNRIALQVVTHVHLEDVMNHVELKVLNLDGFSNRTKGVLSVFPRNNWKSSASVDFVPYKTDRGVLNIKQSEIKLLSQEVYDSESHKFGKCWLLESLIKLTGGNLNHYKVNHAI